MAHCVTDAGRMSPPAGNNDRFTVEAIGDSALLLRWGDRIDPQLNLEVHALASRLRAHAPAWLLDVVPAYASLALHIDPAGFERDLDPLREARRWLRAQGEDASDAAAPAQVARVVEVPVRYGGDAGPDLEAVAAHCGIDAAAVVARHCAPLYRVAMLGFAPGFPYLLGLDPGLATPRLAQPRQRIPAGSVGIGGAQTGIYPREGPGGWQLIGRTSLSLFDPERDPPSVLAPGDSLRFVAVDRA